MVIKNKHIMKFSSVFLVLFLIACNSQSNKKFYATNNQEKINFPNSKDIKGSTILEGDTICFSLTYYKNNYKVYDGIKFYSNALMLKSKKTNFLFDFELGIRNDTLFTLDKLFSPKVEPFISFNENKSHVITHSPFLNYTLILDSVIYEDGKKTFKINFKYQSFISGDSNIPRFTLHNIYLNKIEGIKKIEVKYYNTGKIYSSD